MNKCIEIEHFSGPLDLLLQLIEEKELEITTISIADVTEQFLEYLQSVEECRPEEMADFLVIATKLLLIKSYALLPYLQLDEEEDPHELETQLKMYKKYVEAMKVVEEMLEQKQLLYVKKAARSRQVVFREPEGVNDKMLHDYFTDVLKSLEPVVKIPKAALQQVKTVRERFCEIQDMLEKKMRLHFHDLLADSNDRSEVVVTFLALLELVKKQSICVTQKHALDEIIIEKSQ
ncbi:MAG: segregation/condensation protein A [Candidatus Kerfeldbacteria bacterium]